jgi:hypothetical protein
MKNTCPALLRRFPTSIRLSADLSLDLCWGLCHHELIQNPRGPAGVTCNVMSDNWWLFRHRAAGMMRHLHETLPCP